MSRPCAFCSEHVEDEDEYAVNCGAHAECLDLSYDAYLREPRTIARDAVNEQGIGE